MRDRVFNMYGDIRSFIGTFHSLGLRIVRENFRLCGLDNNFTIIDSDDSLAVIKKILKKLKKLLNLWNLLKRFHLRIQLIIIGKKLFHRT